VAGGLRFMSSPPPGPMRAPTNTSDIIDNNNFNGPETVNLSSVYAFQISGGCTWTKMG
jgi:hypothetical protein